MPDEPIQPLDRNQAIVDSRGIPTQYFMRILQDRGVLQGDDHELLADLGEQVATLTASEIIAGTALDGGGKLIDGDVTIDHSDSPVVPDTYGSSTMSAVITVDQQGHVVEVTEAPIAGGGGSSWVGGATGSSGAWNNAGFPTKGSAVIPTIAASIKTMFAWVDPFALGETYFAELVTLSPTNQVTAILATSPSATTVTGNPEVLRFEFPTAVALAAGTRYGLLVCRNNVGGTSGTCPLHITGPTFWYLDWPCEFVSGVFGFATRGSVVGPTVPTVINANAVPNIWLRS